MTRIKMLIEYNGAAYHGFQRQKNCSDTVQEHLENALLALTGEEITVHGASRTDAGVHALGQVIAFDTEASIPPERFWLALNTKLNENLQAYASEAIAEDFHPQFQALKKHYTYLLHNHIKGCVLWRERAWCLPVELDMAAMQIACTHLVGKRDFKTFCSSGSQVKLNFVREIMHCSINYAGADLIRLDIVADGFLYNMVRIIMGTLVDIGRGRISEADLPGIIAAHDRTLAGQTAPPQGLYLVEVVYPDNNENSHRLVF